MAVKGAPAEVSTLIEELKLLNGILADIERAYTSKAADGNGADGNSETLVTTLAACQKHLLETLRMLEESGMIATADSTTKETGNRYKSLFKRMKYPLKRQDVQRSLTVVRDYKANLSLALSVEDRKSTNVIQSMLSRLEAATIRSEENMGSLQDQNSQLLRMLISGMSNMSAPPSYGTVITQIEKHFEVPQRPTATFVGREDILQTINTHFDRVGSVAEQRRCALYGLGGSGKTQIALTFAFRHRSKYDNIFFINAASVDSVTNAFSKIHQVLQLTATDSDEDKIEAVKYWFARGDNTNWLIIFDNADDLMEVDLPAFFPLADSGDILITTRDAQVEDPDITTSAIHLDMLTPEDAKELLLKRSSISSALSNEEDTAAIDIIQQLGCLPLAIDQAGAYIQARKISFKAYRSLYEKQQQSLLGYRSKFSKYQKTVYTTWELSFQKIETESPEVAELLLLLCQYDGSGISDTMLERGVSTQLSYGRDGEELKLPAERSGVPKSLIDLLSDEFQFHEAVARLVSFSLVQRTTTAGFVLHSLVQFCGRSRVAEDLRRNSFKASIRLISHAFPRGSLDDWNTAYSIEFLPQVEHCCQQLENALASGHDVNDISAIAASMFLSAYHFANVHWCERFVKICETLLMLSPSETDEAGLMTDPEFLAAFVVERRGKISPQLGKNEEGIHVLSDFIKKHLSVENRDSMTSVDLVKKTPNHLANSMQGCVHVLLAHQLILAGRETEAVHYLQSWKVLEPSSISERGVIRYRDRTLADAYVAKKSWAEAETTLRSLLAPDMPDAESFRGTLGEGWALQQLAEILHETGRHKAASELLLPAIVSREDSGNEDREDTISLVLVLVACLLADSAYDLALIHLMKLRQLLEPKLGRSNSTIMRHITNMWCLTARLSCYLKDWKEAKMCWERAHESAKQVTWPNGFMIGAIRYSLAYVLWKLDILKDVSFQDVKFEVQGTNLVQGRRLENVGIDAEWTATMTEARDDMLRV
ncbi:hypothetical protein BKA66DRAFT_596980 [Pyrenochaeta sp. MPI-SDFR-AT-0127]|nr:hypothetical protein BKA66DRAFT_596980 [Pyrenochaeta sp. MPI-SDFR-AT-0127]